jgi:hypothetical protein
MLKVKVLSMPINRDVNVFYTKIFNLKLVTSNASDIQIKVYDVIGRFIEHKEASQIRFHKQNSAMDIHLELQYSCNSGKQYENPACH